MRQEHKLTSKRMIEFLSILGIIPFYFELFDHLLHLNTQFEYETRFRNFSFIYGSLIISFLSGMHWQKLINAESIKLLYLPMIPVILVWLSFLFTPEFFFKIIIIIGLIWCLLVDLLILKELNQDWFLKLRSIVTFLAIPPLFVIFFVQ